MDAAVIYAQHLTAQQAFCAVHHLADAHYTTDKYTDERNDLAYERDNF